MRIVFDTNVLISGLISRGSAPAELIEVWHSNRFTLITSREQLLELRRVLNYPKIKKYIRPDQAKTLMDTIVSAAYLVPDILPDVNVSTDPDDNLIIATAIAGNAHLLVSGDKSHLISLSEVQGIPICTPRNAIRIIQKD